LEAVERILESMFKQIRQLQNLPREGDVNLGDSVECGVAKCPVKSVCVVKGEV